MKVRQHYLRALEEINDDIFKMGIRVEEALKSAVDALTRIDTDLAARIIEGDREINQMEFNLENKCILLIAREQPVASDLRNIVTCMRIVSDIERIGDHAVHLAKSCCRLKDLRVPINMQHFKEMGRVGISMFKDVLDAFIEKDAQKARDLALRDHTMDEMHKSTLKKIKTVMSEDSTTIEQGTSLLFASRFLERLGDHVANICEWIVYSVTGEHCDLTH